MTQQNKGEVCERHKGAPAMSHCTQCGTPICRECTKAFGYFCSTECLEQSRSHITTADRQRQAREEEELERAAGIGKAIGVAILLVCLAGVSFLLWTFFLDPSGKMCWTWEREGGLYSFSVLTGNKDVIIVRAGDEIVTLEARRGEPIASIELQSDDRRQSAVEFLDDGFLLMTAKGTARYAKDGRELFTRTSNWERLAACQSPDGTRQFLCMGSPRPQLSYAELLKRKSPLPPQKVVLSCLNLKSGEPHWSTPLSENERVSRLAASDRQWYALHEKWDKDYDMTAFLRAYDPDSGAARWEASLPEAATWGPVVTGEFVLIEVDRTIHAFSEGGQAVWSAEMESSISGRRVLDDALLVNTVDGSRLIDVATGTTRWKTAVSLVPDSVSTEGKRMFAIGFAAGTPDENDDEHGDGALPGSLEKNKDLLSDMGIDLGQAAKTSRPVPSILCLDADTGTLIWQVPNVYGDLCSDGKRLVLVIDTAKTSVLEMVSGGKGVLVLRQYDPKDGSMLYSRQSDVGLHEPRICGNRLVGVRYTRAERPSLMGGFSGGEISMPKALGIAAFKLR